MDLLLTLLLLVAIFVALRLIVSPPAWLRARAEAAAQRWRDEGTTPTEALQWEVLDLPLVRRRLYAVSVELDRLEHDPSVFARAFRTRAFQSAYRALLADEARLAALREATLQLEGELELELVGGPRRPGEVLDL
jgi:hypothetical protein